MLASMPDYAAFQRLTEALAQAASAAKEIATLRPDQSREWEKMAEIYNVAREAAFRLAGTGMMQ